MGVIRVLAILTLGATAVSSPARDYFVAPTGHDSADGFSPGTALKTLVAATSRLRPGDVLRLQRNATWHETLRLPNGEPDRPVRVTAFGGGDLPTIDGAGDRPLDICVDASASHVVIDSLHITHAAAADRGAITVWANQDRTGLAIEGCLIDDNAGRAIWIAGDAGQNVRWVYIHHNTISENAGCGVLATKLADSWVMNNDFRQNCRKDVDQWQAAVRVWSADVRSIWIADNRIENGLHQLDRGAGMGVHVDETGPGVFVTGNDIRHCDAAGVEVENTRGVTIQDNVIFDTHTGVFVYRAGHEHKIDRNTIVARSQGIVLQGWYAHGVDAGPEIQIDGRLFTSNRITHNIAVADQYGSLKLTGGGEYLDGDRRNVVEHNAFGAERKSLIELGQNTFEAYRPLTAQKILQSRAGVVPFEDSRVGDLKVQGDWAAFGARHFLPSR